MAALSGGLAGCGREPIVLHVPFADTDGSAIIAVRTSDQVQLWAVDPELRTMQPILQQFEGWTTADRIEVHAVFFADDLDSFGLEAGPLSPSETGSPLPEGRNALGVLEGTRDVTWTAPPVRATLFDDVRVQLDTPCRRLEVSTPKHFLAAEDRPLGFALDAAGRPHVFTNIFQGGVVSYRAIERTGFGPVTTLDEAYAGIGMTQGLDGSVFLVGGDNGRGAGVLQGRPGEPFADFGVFEPQILFSRRPYRVVAARTSTAGPVLFAANRRGNLYRITEAGWRNVADLGEVEIDDSTDRANLAWRGPEDVFMVRADGQKLVRYRDGEVSPVRTGVDEDLNANRDRIEVIADVPGIGLLAGTDSGILLREAGDGLEVEAWPNLVESTIAAILPFGEGAAIVAGRYGVVDQYYDGYGYCVEQRVFLGNTDEVFRLIRVGEDLLALGVERLPDDMRRYYVQWIDLARD